MADEPRLAAPGAGLPRPGQAVLHLEIHRKQIERIGDGWISIPGSPARLSPFR